MHPASPRPLSLLRTMVPGSISPLHVVTSCCGFLPSAPSERAMPTGAQGRPLSASARLYHVLPLYRLQLSPREATSSTEPVASPAQEGKCTPPAPRVHCGRPCVPGSHPRPCAHKTTPLTQPCGLMPAHPPRDRPPSRQPRPCQGQQLVLGQVMSCLSFRLGPMGKTVRLTGWVSSRMDCARHLPGTERGPIAESRYGP